MKFHKYQHIERLGTVETEGILEGSVSIFSKIDGTNGQCFLENGVVKAGSRNREVSLEEDNQGFCKYILENKEIESFLKYYGGKYKLYGEFLVKHTLRTYKDDAWRKFYVFDVVEEYENNGEKGYRYLPYYEYKEKLEKFNIPYIPCIVELQDPSYKDLMEAMSKNTFLIKDGEGLGEGLVCKNYDFENRFGRTIWGKIVRDEFKSKTGREKKKKGLSSKESVEKSIVEKYVDSNMVEKEYAKIVNEKGYWSSKLIKMLLGKVFYTLVKEESWEIIKSFKKPTVNYKKLQTETIIRVKELKKELF